MYVKVAVSLSIWLIISAGFTFAGALFGFVLARLMYLDITGVFCGPGSGMNHAAPGECYYYLNFDRYAIGIRLHLYTILRESLYSMMALANLICEKLTSVTSGELTRCVSIHPDYSTQAHPLSPHQWLSDHFAGARLQRRGFDHCARSFRWNFGNSGLGRHSVHPHHRGPSTRVLQHQTSSN